MVQRKRVISFHSEGVTLLATYLFEYTNGKNWQPKVMNFYSYEDAKQAAINYGKNRFRSYLKDE